MNFKKITFVGIVLSILAGCQSTKMQLSDFKEDSKVEKKLTLENVNVPTDFFLIGKAWKLKEVNDKVVSDNIVVTMKFQKSFSKKHPVMISGKAACNSYTTDVKVNDETKKLDFSDSFIITSKHCFEEDVMTMEENFISSLKKNKKIYRKNTKVLILKDTKGKKYTFDLL